MSTAPSSYYDGYGSHDCTKNVLPIKPLKEVKKKILKNASIENSKKKKMSTGPNLYYDGYSSYDCPQNVLPIKPLQ